MCDVCQSDSVASMNRVDAQQIRFEYEFKIATCCLPYFSSFSSQFNRADSFFMSSKKFLAWDVCFPCSYSRQQSPEAFSLRIFQIKEPQFKYVICTKGRFSIELPHLRNSLGKGSGCVLGPVSSLQGSFLNSQPQSSVQFVFCYSTGYGKLLRKTSFHRWRLWIPESTRDLRWGRPPPMSSLPK